MGKPLWTFAGYITEAGSKVVQDWYWDDLTVAERDIIRDRAGYLENLPGHLWREPYYESFGDIGEIKKRKTTRGALRIYGTMTGSCFVMLNGVLKKTTKDKQGVRRAEARYKLFRSGKGTSHGFKFKEKSDQSN